MLDQATMQCGATAGRVEASSSEVLVRLSGQGSAVAIGSPENWEESSSFYNDVNGLINSWEFSVFCELPIQSRSYLQKV